jgi:hypothetical protein
MNGLDKAWEQFIATHPPVDADYKSFQAGFTASAVSMRTRALAEVDKVKMPDNIKNSLKTAIGSLPDISQA